MGDGASGSAVASAAVVGVGVVEGSAVGVADGATVVEAVGDGEGEPLTATGIEAGPRTGQSRAGAEAPGGAVPRLPAPSGGNECDGPPLARCHPAQTANGSPSPTIAAKTTFGVFSTPFHRASGKKVT